MSHVLTDAPTSVEQQRRIEGRTLGDPVRLHHLRVGPARAGRARVRAEAARPADDDAADGDGGRRRRPDRRRLPHRLLHVVHRCFHLALVPVHVAVLDPRIDPVPERLAEPQPPRAAAVGDRARVLPARPDRSHRHPVRQGPSLLAGDGLRRLPVRRAPLRAGHRRRPVRGDLGVPAAALPPGHLHPGVEPLDDPPAVPPTGDADARGPRGALAPRPAVPRQHVEGEAERARVARRPRLGGADVRGAAAGLRRVAAPRRPTADALVRDVGRDPDLLGVVRVPAARRGDRARGGRAPPRHRPLAGEPPPASHRRAGVPRDRHRLPGGVLGTPRARSASRLRR